MLLHQNPNSTFPHFVFGDFMHFLYSPGEMLVRGLSPGFCAVPDFTPFMGSLPQRHKIGVVL